jgi:hypothetical protein
MTGVYQCRSTLAALLRRELPSEYIVVPGPDHPLLLQDADILAGGAGILTGLFTPSAAERHQPRLLRSRLILNRLALPLRTRCVLVIEPEDSDIAKQFDLDFDEIVEWHRRREVVRIAGSRLLDEVRTDLSDSAFYAQRQFSSAMTVMRLVARIGKVPFTSAFGDAMPESRRLRTTRSQRGRPRIMWETSSTGYGVPLQEFAGYDPDRQIMRRLITNQTERLYSLDHGVPYPRGGRPGIAMVEEWPSVGRDPYKLIHATAFGGWAFVLNSQRHELPRLAERLARNLQR